MYGFIKACIELYELWYRSKLSVTLKSKDLATHEFQERFQTHPLNMSKTHWSSKGGTHWEVGGFTCRVKTARKNALLCLFLVVQSFDSNSGPAICVLLLLHDWTMLSPCSSTVHNLYLSWEYILFSARCLVKGKTCSDVWRICTSVLCTIALVAILCRFVTPVVNKNSIASTLDQQPPVQTVKKLHC